MILKKVCLLGAFAVGKTSLVSRYVQSIFSDDYLSTIGVKVDKKVVQVGAQEVTLVLWDIAGQDDFSPVRLAYLRGAAGYLLVVDGTRPETLAVALRLRDEVTRQYGALPHLLVLNKSDLLEQWSVLDPLVQTAMPGETPLHRTSAKSGTGVEEAFTILTQRLLAANQTPESKKTHDE